MIQRIQTVYLLIIVALGITLCFEPILTFDTMTEEGIRRTWELSPVSFTETTPNAVEMGLTPQHLNGVVGLTIATLLIPILALVVIFLYKKRILQARLNIFLALLSIGYYGEMGLFAWFGKMNLHFEEVHWHMTPWMAIPAVCFILTLMATRRILKDEALVRAADRIR